MHLSHKYREIITSSLRAVTYKVLQIWPADRWF